MVRSLKVCLLACLLCITFVMPVQASEVPYQGTLSNTYTQIFEDIIADVSIFDNYVFYRSGENEYRMAVGDISVDNGHFTMVDGDLYIVEQVYIDGETSWNQNSYYKYTHVLGASFDLLASDYLVYSDLDGYPKLEERSVVFAFCTLFIMLAVVFAVVVWRIFQFVLRTGYNGR